MRIYNAQGQLVRDLSKSDLGAGYHEMNWDGANKFGSDLISGMYAYTIQITGDQDFKSSGHLIKK